MEFLFWRSHSIFVHNNDLLRDDSVSHESLMADLPSLNVNSGNTTTGLSNSEGNAQDSRISHIAVDDTHDRTHYIYFEEFELVDVNQVTEILEQERA